MNSMVKLPFGQQNFYNVTTGVNGLWRWDHQMASYNHVTCDCAWRPCVKLSEAWVLIYISPLVIVPRGVQNRSNIYVTSADKVPFLVWVSYWLSLCTQNDSWDATLPFSDMAHWFVIVLTMISMYYRKVKLFLSCFANHCLPYYVLNFSEGTKTYIYIFCHSSTPI